VQQLARSNGGAGPELGIQYQFWRFGLRVKGGVNFMQRPKSENLDFNRLRILGGELEFRIGRRQQWILGIGMMHHRYNVCSRETEITQGLTVKSICYTIDQNAKSFGGGYKLKPWLRLSAHYEWERHKFTLEDNYGHPSSSYLVFRASFMLDSNHLKSQKSATGA
jgi:hypothetical protein